MKFAHQLYIVITFFLCYKYHSVSAKFVRKMLNFEQKQHRMEVAQESLNEVNDDKELL